MDYVEELAKVFKGINYTYKGCRIECAKNKFTVFGKTFSTLDEAKAVVDESEKHIEKSIKK